MRVTRIALAVGLIAATNSVLAATATTTFNVTANVPANAT